MGQPWGVLLGILGGVCHPVLQILACVAGSIVWVRDWSFGGGAVFQKKGSRDEAVVKSHSTMLQRLRRQISLDYYTIPPATQAIQILTLFQTKKCHFSHPFSDLEVVTKLNITCLHKTKIMSSLLILKPQQRDLLKSISNLRITLSFWFIWNWNDNTLINNLSSFVNHTQFQTKMGKIYTRFQIKMAQTPLFDLNG